MLIKHRHRLPHWTLDGAYYVITFRLKEGTLNDKEKSIILKNVKEGHNKFYHLVAVQVMPNHVHLIIKPIGIYTPQRIVKGIKGVTSRRINQVRNLRGSLWMVDYFDRIIRNQTDFDEKLKYIYENPVRAGLIDNAGDYEWWYFQDQ